MNLALLEFSALPQQKNFPDRKNLHVTSSSYKSCLRSQTGCWQNTDRMEGERKWSTHLGHLMQQQEIVSYLYLCYVYGN